MYAIALTYQKDKLNRQNQRKRFIYKQSVSQMFTVFNTNVMVINENLKNKA